MLQLSLMLGSHTARIKPGHNIVSVCAYMGFKASPKPGPLKRLQLEGSNLHYQYLGISYPNPVLRTQKSACARQNPLQNEGYYYLNIIILKRSFWDEFGGGQHEFDVASL
jgi:hypothetical protein